MEGSSTELFDLCISDEIKMNKVILSIHLKSMHVLRFVVLRLFYYWAEFNSIITLVLFVPSSVIKLGKYPKLIIIAITI